MQGIGEEVRSVSTSNIVGIVLTGILAFFVITTELGAHPFWVLALCIVICIIAWRAGR